MGLGRTWPHDFLFFLFGVDVEGFDDESCIDDPSSELEAGGLSGALAEDMSRGSTKEVSDIWSVCMVGVGYSVRK